MIPQPTHGTVLMQAYCISLAHFGNSTPPTHILFLCIHPSHSTDQHELIVVLICRIEVPLPHLGTTTNLGSVQNETCIKGEHLWDRILTMFITVTLSWLSLTPSITAAPSSKSSTLGRAVGD
jgi:hypothetical protein